MWTDLLHPERWDVLSLYIYISSNDDKDHQILIDAMNEDTRQVLDELRHKTGAVFYFSRPGGWLLLNATHQHFSKPASRRALIETIEMWIKFIEYTLRNAYFHGDTDNRPSDHLTQCRETPVILQYVQVELNLFVSSQCAPRSSASAVLKREHLVATTKLPRSTSRQPHSLQIASGGCLWQYHDPQVQEYDHIVNWTR